MKKIFTATVFMLLLCITCFGQRTYRGLTPGVSTKAEVQRVLGLPVGSLSETLIQYRFPEANGKTYVQYRDKSDVAVVERIELTCEGSMWEGACHEAMRDLGNAHVEGNVRTNLWPDAVVRAPLSPKSAIYYGAPRFVVITSIDKANNLYDRRFAFYSAALFNAAKPKGGCSGSIFGEWETNRGLMVIERDGNLGFKGSYAALNGSFAGRYDEKAPIRRYSRLESPAEFSILAASFATQQRSEGAFVGEWKDDSGSGTLNIAFEFGQTTFRGTWVRASGSEPGGGTWEGRCIGSKQSQ